MIDLDAVPETATLLAEALGPGPARPRLHRATLTPERSVVCSCGSWQLPGRLSAPPSPASPRWREILLPWVLHVAGLKRDARR